MSRPGWREQYFDHDHDTDEIEREHSRGPVPGKRTLTMSLPAPVPAAASAVQRKPSGAPAVRPRSADVSTYEQAIFGPHFAAPLPATAPSPIQLMPLRAKLGIMVPVQRKLSIADPGSDEATVQRAAAAGVATPTSAMPHADRIQASFARHSLGDVKVHSGSAAADSAAAMGAQAYATGNHIVLGDNPSLHTVAHEAAHVIQQRARVSLKRSVGEEGDAYERHADAVADAVVAGRSAESLLDEMTGGRTVSAAVGIQPTQRKVEHDPSQKNHKDYGKLLNAAEAVDKFVAQSVDLIATSPSLANLGGDLARSGHITNWQRNYHQYIQNPSEVPQFIYAAYGYAVETIACTLLGASVNEYKIRTQVAHGHTRPDIVLLEPENGKMKEVAWLDITSSASKGHIYKKQHSAWSKGPIFVAEVTYPQLDVTALASTDKSLSDAQKQQLSAANKQAQERSNNIAVAVEHFSRELAIALETAYDNKVDGLSNTDIKDLVKAYFRTLDIPPRLMNNIIANLDVICFPATDERMITPKTKVSNAGVERNAGAEWLAKQGARLRAGQPPGKGENPSPPDAESPDEEMPQA